MRPVHGKRKGRAQYREKSLTKLDLSLIETGLGSQLRFSSRNYVFHLHLNFVDERGELVRDDRALSFEPMRADRV